MNVVVLGASGFLGSHVAEQLCLAGHSVRCLVRESSHTDFLESLDLQLDVVDFNNEGAITDKFSSADMVFNCIADTRLHASYEDKATTEITLTCLLFKLAQQAKVQRFVQLSTVMAVGFDRPDHAIDETFPPAPVHTYSRIAADREANLLQAYIEGETQLVLLRPSNAAGKRDVSFLPSFIQSVKMGMFPVMLNGACRFSCIDARDVGRAMTHLLAVELHQPEIYFVKGYDISWLELKQAMDKKMKAKSRLFNMPKSLFMLFARLMEWIFPYGKEPPLVPFSMEVLSNNLLFDDNKIIQTGFSSQYSLAETLDDVID